MTKPTGRPRGRPPKVDQVQAPESDQVQEPNQLQEPAESPAAAVADLLPAPPADTAPDPQAAIASLTPPPSPPGETVAARLDERPPAGKVVGSIAAHTAPVESPAPVPGRWSRRQVERANRKELAGRIRELETQVAAMRPLGVPGEAAGDSALVPAADPVRELEDLFGLVMPAVSALLEYLVGPEMKLDATEQRVLVKTGTPAALPYYGKAKAAAPVAPFILTVAAVFAPKVVESVKAKRAKRAAAEIESPTVDSSPAPAVPRPTVSSSPAPAPIVQPLPGRDRFGGPRE